MTAPQITQTTNNAQKYKITALYFDYPGHDPFEDAPHAVTVEVESSNEPFLAAVYAVAQAKIPVQFLNVGHGPEAIYWAPELYTKGQRWPEVIESSSGYVLLGFGDENDPHTLNVNVTALIENE